MEIGSHKIYLDQPFVFSGCLFVSFILIFGTAYVIASNTYRGATRHVIASNETRADLLAKVILEHQRAAIGVLRSYASRPEVIDSVKHRHFEETVRHLKCLVKDNPEIGAAFIADPTGIMWGNFPVHREALNQDLSYRDWYKGVIKSWNPYVSSVYKRVVGEKDLAVAVCTPGRDKKEKIIGILGATQTTLFFNRLIGEIGLNADSKITLVDQEGQIIYSNRVPYTREVMPYPLLRSIKQTVGRAKGNVEIHDPSDGDKVKYFFFEPIEGIGWSVFIEKEKTEVLRSELRQFIQMAVISALLLTAVTLFLVYHKQKHKQSVEMNPLPGLKPRVSGLLT